MQKIEILICKNRIKEISYTWLHAQSREFDIWKIPDYNYIKNILDIPICNNHNKEILIFELTLPNITPPSFYLGFTVPL